MLQKNKKTQIFRAHGAQGVEIHVFSGLFQLLMRSIVRFTQKFCTIVIKDVLFHLRVISVEKYLWWNHFDVFDMPFYHFSLVEKRLHEISVFLQHPLCVYVCMCVCVYVVYVLCASVRMCVYVRIYVCIICVYHMCVSYVCTCVCDVCMSRMRMCYVWIHVHVLQVCMCV